MIANTKNYGNKLKRSLYYHSIGANISFSKLMSMFLKKMNLKVLNKFDPQISILTSLRNLWNSK